MWKLIIVPGDFPDSTGTRTLLFNDNLYRIIFFTMYAWPKSNAKWTIIIIQIKSICNQNVQFECVMILEHKLKQRKKFTFSSFQQNSFYLSKLKSELVKDVTHTQHTLTGTCLLLHNFLYTKQQNQLIYTHIKSAKFLLIY